MIGDIHLDNYTYYSYFTPDTVYSCNQVNSRTVQCTGFISIVGTRPDLFGLDFDLSMHIRSQNYSEGDLRYYYSFQGAQSGGETIAALNKYVYIRYGNYSVPFEVAEAGYLDLYMGPEPYNYGDWHVRLNTPVSGYSWAGSFTLTVSLDPIVPNESTLNWGEFKQRIKTVAADRGSYEISSIRCSQEGVGDPINTRSGVFSFASPDLSFPTSAGTLAFQPAYSSGTVALYADVLGYGWTHNHDARLIFPSDPGGIEGVVLFKDMLGNQYRFIARADGSYEPWPGVLATLTPHPGPLPGEREKPTP